MPTPKNGTRIFFFGTLALALAGACASSAGYFLLKGRKSEYIASRVNQLELIADLKADAIGDFHRERVSDLKFYSTDPHLVADYRRVLAGSPTDRADIEAVFRSLVERGLYASVALVDGRGRAALQVPKGSEVLRPGPGSASGPRLLGSRRGGDGVLYLDYEAPTVEGARLVLRLRAVSWLTPFFKRWHGPEKTGEVLVFERGPSELVSLTDATPARVRLDSDAIAARAARGETGPILGPDYRGETCWAVTRSFPELGWILVAKVAENELMEPLREKLRLHLFAAGGVAALLAAFVLVFLRAKADQVRAESDAERRLLAAAIEQAGESVVITDKQARILYTNPAFTRASGWSREEARGLNPSILKSGRHEAGYYKAMWDVLSRGDAWTGRLVNRRKDGVLYEEDASITPVKGDDGAVTHYIAVKRDVSAVKSLEDQLYHSQKMEAIGRLAGGVAHDFNNILTTINGYAEMLLDAAPPQSQPAADLSEILGAGRRAALLTRQLLTFSRRAPAVPVVVDLRAQVRSVEKMLRRTMGEDVTLRLELAAEPVWVRTDPGQIDQVLMNLAVNSRDAMPRGGTVTVSSYHEDLETDSLRGVEAIPAGRYAVLRVADDGEGMTKEVLSRLFEPFFTTKEKGKGTGLGLATVFGIVKQNKGHIAVDSRPGGGSTFTIHLPAAEGPEYPAAAAPEAPAKHARGDETVMVVEDQAEVLRLVSLALTAQGYRVHGFTAAREALAAARTLEGPIHLLLTDVVMPGMGGKELAEALAEFRPETRVLYMSGYTDGRLDSLVESGQKADLMLKPFTAQQACRRVRDALDGAPPTVA